MADKDSVVRINSELLAKVEEFIKKELKILRYVNKKQFVDLAVFEKLKKEGEIK